MIVSLLFSLLFQAGATSPSITADLDGDGSAETVTVIPRRSGVDIEIRNAAGKQVAKARAPAPGPAAPAIVLTTGALGDAGAILEVAASAAQGQCRTFWRLRGQGLSSVPLLGTKGRLPDCSPPEGWTERWKKPRNEAPADYVRERTRPTADGEYHRVEIYRFTGFELRLDPARSTAEIGGAPIPDWSGVVLYPRPLVDALFSCFHLSSFRSASRLSFATDRDEGVFALVVERGEKTDRLAVNAAAPGKAKGEWNLTAGPSISPVRLDVQLDKDGRNPLEVTTDGFGEEFGRVYIPISRLTPNGLELFANAEDELARRSLTGPWDNSHGERLLVTSVSIAPDVLQFGRERVTLSIARAPQGADVLLVPRDGSPPKTALLLRGPNVLARLSVTCSKGASLAPEGCRIEGPGEVLHRVGAQVNAR